MRDFNFTAREARTIKAAFHSLIARLDRTSHCDRPAIENACKSYKRDMPVREAEALVLKAFRKGMLHPETPAKYLTGLRTDYLAAFLKGAGLCHLSDEQELVDEMNDAANAYDDARTRHFDRVHEDLQAARLEVAS